MRLKGLGSLPCDNNCVNLIFDQAFGLHVHEEHDTAGGGHADHSEDTGFIWKGLVVLASVYGFFLFETLMHLGLKSKVGEHGGHSHIDVEVSSYINGIFYFNKKKFYQVFGQTLMFFLSCIAQ